MKRAINILSTPVRLCAAVAVALALLALPAWAADPIFPTGSRLGLVPPPGMVRSRNFEGFEDPTKHAAVLLAALPADAYDQLDKSMLPETLRKQGIDVDKRDPVELSFGKGFIISGKQTTDKGHFRKWLLIAAANDFTALATVQVQVSAPDQPADQDQTYSDSVIRTALATLTVRASVPDAERLSLLPFTVGDMAGFHIDDVVPGNALMLIDTPATGSAHNTHVLVAALPGGPEEAKDRDNFARVQFEQIGGIKDVHVQDAEPLRIDGQSGYETLASAKEGQTGADVMVVEWLRFGSGGYLQMIGIAPTDAWPEAFTRLRTVRDSIDSK